MPFFKIERATAIMVSPIITIPEIPRNITSGSRVDWNVIIKLGNVINTNTASMLCIKRCIVFGHKIARAF